MPKCPFRQRIATQEYSRPITERNPQPTHPLPTGFVAPPTCQQSNKMSNPAASAAVAGSNEPPGPPRGPFPCDHCERCFSSARGRTLHARRAHPVEFHANAEARGAARTALNWKEEEKELLAQAEARMICDGSYNALNINTALVGSIGLRTHQAIKGRRRNADHKARVQRWINIWNNEEQARSCKILTGRTGCAASLNIC